ncbi:hypothetical protein SeMB42_g00938 [Synchytrium endobioticum]|uniref:Nucleolar complex protein 2 n=1 Tax=Synchytrium endobioticum TaxID=286115 RepID=A0A507DN54_9FUNG|nr:hypothetical protein SeLEV6574_g06381 [Synchytrium endobioticum]TPX53149.1 hypothetical protein SeMB42_g00938 [Synchytrium endobioticum]
MARVKKSTKKFLTKKNALSEAISRRKQNQVKKKWIDKKKRKPRPDHDPEDEEQAERVKTLSRRDGADDDEEEDVELREDADMDEQGNDAMDESSDDDEAALLAENDEDSEEDLDEEQYKQQLQALEKSDPEFFKYLKENDKSLLDFDIDDGEDTTMQDDNEEEGEDQEETDLMSKDEGHKKVLTAALIEDWKKNITEKHSKKHLKQICVAFRNAIATISGDDKTPQNSYDIDDPNVFNMLMLACLREVPAAFIHHLYGDTVDSESASTSAIPSSKPKWTKFKILIKIHIKALLAFLNHVSDEVMIDHALLHSERMVGFVACFPKLCKDWIKVLMHQWAIGASNLRVRAFLGVRKLALVSSGMLEQCLKASYATFIAACGLVNAHTITNLNFMLNCLVELCGMNETSTYYNAFVYIRQLAIHLRGALMNPTKEAYRKVYNWQYYFCLKLWSQVFSTHATGSASYQLSQTRPSNASSKTTILQPLIYPLVQIILGVIKLKPSSKYLPLRFNLIRILIDLSKSTGYYIPLASLLLEVFDMSDVRSNGRPSSMKPIDWALNIKVGKMYLGTKPYQRDVVEETVDLLFEYYSNSALSIEFPEIVLPTVFHLRRIAKAMSTNQHHRKTVQTLVEILEKNMRFIEQRRSNVEFGPNDIVKCNAFLADLDPSASPLGKHNSARRQIKDAQRKD